MCCGKPQVVLADGLPCGFKDFALNTPEEYPAAADASNGTHTKQSTHMTNGHQISLVLL